MSSSTRIYQIYFHPDQRIELDPSFIPFDNSQSPRPDEFEFHVFRTEYDKGMVSDSGHTGYVSWKFQEKTGVKGTDFIQFCDANPGYDVYFINPFPIEIFLGNVWQQGDARHPGLLELTQHVFDSIGYSIDLNSVPRSLRLSSFCNYWAGNKRFWDEYMKFCLPIYNHIQKGLDEAYRKKLMSKADPYRKASYFAFIFERLFTTFLASRPDIKALGYQYSETELLRKYPQDAAVIVQELQKIEAQFPEDRQPIDRSALIRAALNLYYLASERSFTPVGRSVYLAMRRVANWLPHRSRLRKLRAYRSIAHYVLCKVRPESTNLTQPPGSL